MYRTIIGYSVKDLKGISPSLCTHRNPMDQDHMPVREHQQCLNNAMREVVKKEVLKLLKARVIYPVSDCEWVSPVQMVPKKGGMTVTRNEKNEHIPQRTITGGGCVSTTRNSTKLLGRIISRYPSLMKC
jgi:hypothetical protein